MFLTLYRVPRWQFFHIISYLFCFPTRSHVRGPCYGRGRCDSGNARRDPGTRSSAWTRPGRRGRITLRSHDRGAAVQMTDARPVGVATGRGRGGSCGSRTSPWTDTRSTDRSTATVSTTGAGQGGGGTGGARPLGRARPPRARRAAGGGADGTGKQSAGTPTFWRRHTHTDSGASGAGWTRGLSPPKTAIKVSNVNLWGKSL